MDLAAHEFTPLPAVFGHEGVGIVEEVGPNVTRTRPGDRIVMSFGSCGVCPNCCQSRPYQCDKSWEITFSGRRLDGSPTVFEGDEPVSACFFQQSAFAEWAITRQEGVVVVSRASDPTILAAMPCGAMTGVGVVFNQLVVRPGDSLSVFGAGAVGLSAVMAARIAGASQIIVSDVNPERLNLARQLGATHTVDAREGDVARRIRDVAPRGVRYAIDTSGASAAFGAAVSSLGVGGVLAACILPQPMNEFRFSPLELFEKAGALVSVSFGNSSPQEMIPLMISLFESGRLPIDRLVTTYPFERINDACADAKRGSVIKPVLMMA